jgi:HEAT repeat protein
VPLIRRDPPAARPPSPRGEEAAADGEALVEAQVLVEARGLVEAQALVDALGVESDPRRREMLFTRLIEAADPRPVAALLRSENAALRSAAADGLRIMAAAALPLLPALLADPDPDVRTLAIEAALGLPGEAATQALIPVLLSDPDANVCGAAVEVLAEVGTPAAIAALRGLCDRFPQNPFLPFACDAALARLDAP